MGTREGTNYVERSVVVVRVTKKQVRGVCEVNRISLTSMVSKVLCKSRLPCVVEEKGLIAEEQGGFQKGEDVGTKFFLWYCWEKQMVRKSTGMLVVFIDFSKAYDKVVRDWRSCARGHVCRVWA